MGIEELRVHDFPAAATLASSVLLFLAIGCAVIVTLDLLRRPQPMTVMNFVWPLTMLFGSLLWLTLYWRLGCAPLPGGPPQHASTADALASRSGRAITVPDAPWGLGRGTRPGGRTGSRRGRGAGEAVPGSDLRLVDH